MHDTLSPVALKRCAIYTRKSTECPTGQEMNSLAGQRAVCAAYIKCQAHKGWVEVDQRYDDEGFTGANLDRPALHRLLKDAREGRIDVILFYKIDRLTRSLSDFVRLMDAFQHFDLSFVSVTQSFDTSDSMGRMVLNILLTFAQFEREMMGDRIRDKKNTMRRSGLYIGGNAPIGYMAKKGRLTVIPSEAQLVREAFDRFDDYPSTASLLRALDAEGKGKLVSRHRMRGGRRRPLWYSGSAQKLFHNPLYAGYQLVEGELVKANHEPFITLERWREIQLVLATRTKKSGKVDPAIHPLAGLIFDDSNRTLAPRMRGSKRWPQRYYESVSRQLRRGKRIDSVRIRGVEIEQVVNAAIVSLLEDPEKLRAAVIRAYADPELAHRMQMRGPAAAARLASATGIELAHALRGLVARVEVAKTEVRLWVSLRVLDTYLNWNGLGLFIAIPEATSSQEDLHLLRVDAILGPHRVKLKLSYERRPGENLNRRLVTLLHKAAKAEVELLQDPVRDIDRHAETMRLGPSKYSRLLRLNYLAPDIKAAILDGRQPDDLTDRKLLYSPLPADWQQQRAILGFPTPPSDRTYLSLRSATIIETESH